MDIKTQKKELRKKVRAEERRLCGEYKRQADQIIGWRVEGLPEYRQAETVFAFVGMDREIDTRPLLERILADGKRLCVPLCRVAGMMDLKVITSLDELRPGTWGILEPSDSAPSVRADEVDLAVIPCVSCSHEGLRLGQGGGYYDRFLEGFRGCAALICREALTLKDIPVEAHDAVIPVVITEKGVFRNI